MEMMPRADPYLDPDSHDPEGDLPAIRDEYSGEHPSVLLYSGLMRNSG